MDADVDERWVPGRACCPRSGADRRTPGFISHGVNPDYRRLKAVSRLAKDDNYKQEVQGLNLSEHILQSEPEGGCLRRLGDADNEPQLSALVSIVCPGLTPGMRYK
jgi:hypothetical protein